MARYALTAAAKMSKKSRVLKKIVVKKKKRVLFEMHLNVQLEEVPALPELFPSPVDIK